MKSFKRRKKQQTRAQNITQHKTSFFRRALRPKCSFRHGIIWVAMQDSAIQTECEPPISIRPQGCWPPARSWDSSKQRRENRLPDTVGRRDDLLVQCKSYLNIGAHETRIKNITEHYTSSFLRAVPERYRNRQNMTAKERSKQHTKARHKSCEGLNLHRTL